jgi:hypothetical protein
VERELPRSSTSETSTGVWAASSVRHSRGNSGDRVSIRAAYLKGARSTPSG